jgi:hypothetical protein
VKPAIFVSLLISPLLPEFNIMIFGGFLTHLFPYTFAWKVRYCPEFGEAEQRQKGLHGC